MCVEKCQGIRTLLLRESPYLSFLPHSHALYFAFPFLPFMFLPRFSSFASHRPDSGAAELMTPHKQEMSRQGSILQEYDHHQQLMRLQDQVRQQHYDGPATPLHQQPITMSLSRFDSNDGTASLVFCLQDANAAQTTLAPWNSIYIPKQYRVPIPGQRQSSPGTGHIPYQVGFMSHLYLAEC